MKTARSPRLFAVRARGAACASLLSLVCVASNAESQAPPLAGFDTYVAESMKAWKVPGLAIAVVKGDQVVLAKGYGVREFGKPAPVDDQTLFAIGSATKAFTASAIGMLVDDGKLALDSAVTAYLPGFQLYDPYATREATVRDLLSHRTGVAGGDLLWASGAFDRDEIVRRLRFIPPAWSFRSMFDYSNVMFIAAGQVLAAAAGANYDVVVRERILQPLGMTGSNTTVRHLSAGGNVATPHEPTGRDPRPVAWRNMDNTVAGGGINSSARDMARWLGFQLSGGLVSGRRLLSKAFIHEMRTPQTVIRREGFWADMTPKAHFMAYGLGWIVSDYHGREVLQHGGGIDGMSAMVGLMPEEGVGVVVLSNLNGNQLPASFMYRVFDAFLGVEPTDWSAVALEAVRNAGAAPATAPRPKADGGGTSPSLELAAYAGIYRHDAWGDVTIRLDEGRLAIRYGTEFDGVLEHVAYDRFRARWRNPARGTSQVHFTLDIDRQPALADIYFWMVGHFRRVPPDVPTDTR